MQALMFCDMSTYGGGWMGFASMSPYNYAFTGTSGDAMWTVTTYSYSTYSPYGKIGDYWRDISKMAKYHLMLKSGSGKYWTVVKLSDIAVGHLIITSVATSMNTGNSIRDTKTAVSWWQPDTTYAADPQLAMDDWTQNYDYMLWGENNAPGHYVFAQANGGSIMLLRGTYALNGYLPKQCSR